jgi:hypothetical protein
VLVSSPLPEPKFTLCILKMNIISLTSSSFKSRISLDSIRDWFWVRTCIEVKWSEYQSHAAPTRIHSAISKMVPLRRATAMATTAKLLWPGSSGRGGGLRRALSGRSPPTRRVKHVVMFDFATKSARHDVVRQLLHLPVAIPSILRYELGEDLRFKSGQNHPTGKNRQICWSCEFATPEDFEAYQAHAAHQAFLETLKPLVRPGSRAAIQYEVFATTLPAVDDEDDQD